MRRRPHVRYSSLTSLLDVLFILLFASLARAAGVVERYGASHDAAADAATTAAPATAVSLTPPTAAATAPTAPTYDAGPPPPVVSPSRVELRTEAIKALSRGLEEKTPLFVRISAAGSVVGIDVSTEQTNSDQEIGVPLLERVSDPDVALSYLGDKTAALQVCNIVMRHLGKDDLERNLVVFAPEVPLAELPTALVMGLRRDEERCARDAKGVAVTIEPKRVDLDGGAPRTNAEIGPTP